MEPEREEGEGSHRKKMGGWTTTTTKVRRVKGRRGEGKGDE